MRRLRQTLERQRFALNLKRFCGLRFRRLGRTIPTKLSSPNPRNRLLTGFEPCHKRCCFYPLDDSDMRSASLVKPLLVAGLLFSGLASANPTAREVLAASPVDDIVAQYPAMMSEGIREGVKKSGQVPPMVADTLGYLVANSFSVREIERKLATAIDEELTAKERTEVLEWYQTPVAEKIAGAEIAASAPASWPEIRARAAELNERYDGTDRAAMFTRFDQAARATESAVDTTIAVQLGLATAMSALGKDSVHFDQIEERIESQRGAMQAVMSKQVYDSYLYTYRNVSNQEMDLYLDFLESDAGRAFTSVVTRSVKQAVTDPIENIGTQIGRFIGPNNAGVQ